MHENREGNNKTSQIDPTRNLSNRNVGMTIKTGYELFFFNKSFKITDSSYI